MKPLTLLFALLLPLAAACGKQETVRLPVKINVPVSVADDAKALDQYPHRWIGSKTVTVAPGVHVLSRLFPSAAFAIETKKGVILIDSGVDESGQTLRESLWEVGLKADQLRYILLTHAHYDHVFGTNKLRAVSDAIVCAGREDCQTLRTADQDAMFSVFPRVPYSGDPIAVDRELDDGDSIQLGGITIEVIGAPGHTPGSVCYLLNKDGQRILFSGDVIASLNYGPATYPVHISPQYRGDAKSYLETINRLLEMEPPDLLLTGHPQQQRQMFSARLSAEQWKRLLEPAQSELQQAVSRHQQDGADFLDEQAKQIESGLWYLGILDGTGVYCIKSQQQLIVMNAPGGDHFAGFLRDRLRLLGLEAKEPDTVLLTSSDQRRWSGLTSLQSSPRIVANPSIHALISKSGIENVASPGVLKELAIDHIMLGESLAYLFSVDDKQVLATPEAPRHLSLLWRNRLTGNTRSGSIEPQSSNLRKELSASPTAAEAYQLALDKLGEFSPSIWLPVLPLTGQNANLYDDQWRLTIADNRRQIP